MLDFVIFAVTFLLILVGAVLYLCPVNKRGVSRGGWGMSVKQTKGNFRRHALVATQF